MFMIIPIWGANSYDPWFDVNDDGVINMRDIAAEVAMFNAQGNPTKPVVINDNWIEGNYSMAINPQAYWLFYNTTAGFREVTVSFCAYVSIFAGSQTYDIYVGFKRGTLTNQIDHFTDTATSGISLSAPPYVPSYVTRTYEVTGSQMWIEIYNSAPGGISTSQPITASVSIFMTT
jgi:hypothetical protein